MTARYSDDRTLVELDTAQGRMFIPLARWPEVAEAHGLGGWNGNSFVPDTPLEPMAAFRPLPRKRLIFGLMALGKTEAEVLAVIAAHPDPAQREVLRVEFENTEVFHRHHPLMIAMLASLGIGAAAADAQWLVQQEGLS